MPSVARLADRPGAAVTFGSRAVSAVSWSRARSRTCVWHPNAAAALVTIARQALTTSTTLQAPVLVAVGGCQQSNRQLRRGHLARPPRTHLARGTGEPGERDARSGRVAYLYLVLDENPPVVIEAWVPARLLRPMARVDSPRS